MSQTTEPNPNPAPDHLETEAEFEARWWELMHALKARFGKKPDLNALLLLIGVQELGQGVAAFTKEEKQDLMHIATCKLFSISGYYELERLDEDGWPHYRLLQPVPFANLKEQERMLKWHMLEYFEAMESGG